MADISKITALDGIAYDIKDATARGALQSKAATENGTDLSMVTTGEKYAWNNASSGSGTITGITMNGSSMGTSGVVDLGTVITAHQDISGKKNTQTAVSDPTASGTGVSYIATISQNTQGVITATKSTVRTMGAASSSAAGTTGLVPAPGKGYQDGYLKADGTWYKPAREVRLGGTKKLDGGYAGNATVTPINFVAGSNVSITYASGGSFTFAATDTTYESKSASSGGSAVSLVTTGEKYTWNHIADSKADDSAVVHLTGEETISGQKWFTANPYIKPSSRYKYLYFKHTTDETGGTSAFIGVDAGNTTNQQTNRMYFAMYSPHTSDAYAPTNTGKYERFYLPAVDKERAGNEDYTIITTKPSSTTSNHTKFFRGDGTWADPTDTTYTSGSGISIATGFTINNTGVISITTGSANGQITVNVGNANGTSTANAVSVYGLDTAAYKAYADNSSATALTNSATTLPTVRKIYYAIKNNVTTTAGGYMLDARIGKDLNDAITSMFIIKDYTATWSTLSSRAKMDLTGTNFSVSTPSGYSPVAVVKAWSGNPNTDVAYFDATATGSSVLMRIRNNSSSAVSSTTQTASISILYVKTTSITS